MKKHKLNHIAYIMDGNGRWATKKNKPRNVGHLEGAKVIPKVIDYAINENIKYLSLFAFSVENWNRPKLEVEYLLQLLIDHLTNKTKKYLNKKNIKLNWIGFETNLNPLIVRKIKSVVESTKDNKGIIVNIFFNYSGTKDIENAFEKILDKNFSKKISNIKELLLTSELPPIDLLIRTGNEKRISNFALYDLAYSEIIFEEALWPDYNELNFNSNVKEYYNRDRRFGKINEQ
ncbi:polyprenyl diphosphate synthase [Malacoplasma muris]|uniref:polyprenyl diphosphate synthase n=1 Tax=Malacoplasma muris TaxID=2119 RepID=UPI00398EDFED